LTPKRQTPFSHRHRVVLPYLLLSVVVHLLAVSFIADWRQRAIDKKAFEVRLLQVVRFEPRRLVAQHPVATGPTQMEYRPAEVAERPIEEATLIEAPPRLEVVPEPVVSLRTIDVATREDTFRAQNAEDVTRVLAQMLESRDSLRRQSFDLMRIQDLAQGRERAVVLVDPTSRRHITGFVNLTRLRLRGAGGGPLIRLDALPPTGGSGLEALARFMRDHTDLLVQVRPEAAESVVDPSLMEDPIHFLIEGGGLTLIEDWPLLQLTTLERDFLEAYMRQGGLLFFEGRSRFNSQVVELLEELLGSDAGIRPLPVDHPIYRAFYTFPAGFPGENKSQWDYLADISGSWVYPDRQYADLLPAPIDGPANLDPNLGLSDDSGIDPLGLWGVSLGDTLVAVVSDLDLHTRWFGSLSGSEDIAINSAPALYTGVNLIVHALTRKGTVARSRALPAWRRTRPRVGPVVLSVDSLHDGSDQVDPGLYGALDASIALVRAPLGTSLGAGGVAVRVDGRYRIDVLRASRNGLLLHNLKPGDHWIELEYAGQVEGIEVILHGGLVATVTFGVSRLAMLRSVHLEVQSAQVAVAAWRATFSDLDMEEVFLQEDEDFPMPP
jgi:hypothetical protein